MTLNKKKTPKTNQLKHITCSRSREEREEELWVYAGEDYKSHSTLSSWVKYFI